MATEVRRGSPANEQLAHQMKQAKVLAFREPGTRRTALIRPDMFDTVTNFISESVRTA